MSLRNYECAAWRDAMDRLEGWGVITRPMPQERKWGGTIESRVLRLPCVKKPFRAAQIAQALAADLISVRQVEQVIARLANKGFVVRVGRATGAQFRETLYAVTALGRKKARGA